MNSEALSSSTLHKSSISHDSLELSISDIAITAKSSSYCAKLGINSGVYTRRFRTISEIRSRRDLVMGLSGSLFHAPGSDNSLRILPLSYVKLGRSVSRGALLCNV